jgi:hypothetical protein
MPENFKFDLGEEVKDSITGFKGVIRARTQYLTGCTTYALQSKDLKDGRPQDWVWIDEDLLKAVSKTKNIIKQRGGPITPDQIAPNNYQ